MIVKLAHNALIPVLVVLTIFVLDVWIIQNISMRKVIATFVLMDNILIQMAKLVQIVRMKIVSALHLIVVNNAMI